MPARKREPLRKDPLLTQALLYRMTNIENEVTHHSYSDEKRMDVLVRNGDRHLVEILSDLNTATSMYHAGKMAISQEKQVEYYSVLAITFCVRSGIHAGMDPSEAYSINDIGLQKLSQARSVDEYCRIVREAVEAILDRVDQIRMADEKSPAVKKARQYIAKNLNRDFSLQELAEQVGLSPYYLSRIFSREEGMTVREYTQRLRVQAAQDLLKAYNFSIEQIGLHLCFCSQSHFTSVFRKYTGTTPENYRKSHFQD